MREYGVILVVATTPKPWLDPAFRHAVRVAWEKKVPAHVGPDGLRWTWDWIGGRLFFIVGAGWSE